MMTRQPIINLLRPFLRGWENDWAGGCLNPGTAGGGAAIVGANNCLPQLRQNPSPGAAGVPQCEQTVAFNVGSLMLAVLDSSLRHGPCGCPELGWLET